MTSAVTQAFLAVRERMEQIPQEIEPFAEWLSKRKPIHAIEIGVRYGGTAALWHSICSGLVVGVDWYGPDGLGAVETLQNARSMMLRYRRYTFVEGDSKLESTRMLVRGALNGERVDFLFLDGDHSYAGVKRDWEIYRPMVNAGGCVAFHDIVDSAFIRSVGHGVYKFWQELEGKKTEFCVGADWGGIGVIEV